MNTMQAKDIQAYLGAYRKEALDQRVLTMWGKGVPPPVAPPPLVVPPIVVSLPAAGGGMLHGAQKGYQALGRLVEKHPGKVTLGIAGAYATLLYAADKISKRSQGAPVVMTEEQAKAPSTGATPAPATPTTTPAPTKEKAPLLTPGQKNLMIGGGVGLGAVATLYLIDKALSRKTKRAPKPRGTYYNG